jgi:hypothetical protein
MAKHMISEYEWITLDYKTSPWELHCSRCKEHWKFYGEDRKVTMVFDVLRIWEACHKKCKIEQQLEAERGILTTEC